MFGLATAKLLNGRCIMVNEYDKIDNLFMHMWQDCIEQLEYDTDSAQQNRVLMDAAKSKLDEVLEIVSDLMAERDELQDRMKKIKELVS